ncbi:MAG: ATP-binding cassette domain-containing protein [Planctomycetes bacterium]|nr:ATP-binding cassette domain-containing protein [Planctomycetota bacterium]
MIRLDDVSVRFEHAGANAVAALAGVSLEVAHGETLCLIGGSGSGKTTCLRLMNRLQAPSSGRVLFRRDDVAQLDPIRLRRSMGYVIQEGGLFPHLDVRANVGLLCELEGWDRARIASRVDELLELVRLPASDYGERFPAELSGGERQRVGIARAFALDPPVVLMDEPFGALDPLTREHLQREFQGWKSASDRTFVLVSHDLREAFELADRIALLRAGLLVQVGTASDLLERPADDYVATFTASFAGA